MTQRRAPPVQLDRHRVIADMRYRLIVHVGEVAAARVIEDATRRSGPNGTALQWLEAATEVVEEQLDAAVRSALIHSL